MAKETNPLNLFLPTHPRRGFHKGDRVLHNGQGASYRGCIGIVKAFERRGGSPKIIVTYDNAYRDEVDYTPTWALENLLVSCVDLMEKDTKPGFNNEYYVGKYYIHAVTASMVGNYATKYPIAHATLKQKVEAAVPRNERPQHSAKGIQQYRMDRLQSESHRIKATKQINQETPMIILVETPEQYLVREAVSGINTRETKAMMMTMEEIAALPVGKYEIYSLARNLEVKPKAQTELVWS